MKAHPFSPEELRPVLGALSRAGAVLVGGQCINVWSTLLQEADAEPWKSSRPYTSFDADAVASRVELAAVTEELQRLGFRTTVELPRTDEERAVNTGLIIARKGRREIAVNLLTGVLGIPGAEVRRNVVTLDWDGLPLHLLHPQLCVESKTLNLLQLPQDVPGETRQDRKHLVLAIANLRRRLETAGPEVPPESLLDVARRTADFALDDPGRIVLARHGLDVLAGIPWTRWREAAAPELRAFAGREPEFRAEQRRRDAAEQEVAQWLETLQQSAPAKRPRLPKRRSRRQK